ncbi:helix-turn-helix domain-containing protein [Spirillospora sp. NPDC029432]|uniref:helix-turn-helix domain-containing protein n=1 Tax=Spirillospora sp. NPDC029432 TaxID=3154599 RepID=UPI0034557B87
MSERSGTGVRKPPEPFWGTLPVEVVEPLHPYVDDVAHEMIEWIRERIPEYARPFGSSYGQKMYGSVRRAVSDFLVVVSSPDASWEPVREIYAGIGAYEARKGRSLESLQTAMRLCGQVAARLFTQTAARLDWPHETLGRLIESLFAYLDAISEAAADGYARVHDRPGSQREHLRARLHAMLTGDGLADRVAITQLARSTGWGTPSSIAVVAVRGLAGQAPPLLPPPVLADWQSQVPSLVLPDPDSPGHRHLLAGLGDLPAAVGPTVDLSRGNVSLMWARRALELAETGKIPVGGVIRCVDHLPTLVASMGLDLIEAAIPQRLAPLMDLNPNQRRRLVSTLLTYLENGRNAAAAAQRLNVHTQTVRYRLSSLEDLFSGELTDPERHLELLLLLHSWQRLLEPAAD